MLLLRLGNGGGAVGGMPLHQCGKRLGGFVQHLLLVQRFGGASHKARLLPSCTPSVPPVDGLLNADPVVVFLSITLQIGGQLRVVKRLLQRIGAGVGAQQLLAGGKHLGVLLYLGGEPGAPTRCLCVSKHGQKKHARAQQGPSGPVKSSHIDAPEIQRATVWSCTGFCRCWGSSR